MSDPYRTAPAARMFVIEGEGAVDLADVVEFWRCSRGDLPPRWEMRLRGNSDISAYNTTVGPELLAAWVAYRREQG